MRAFAIILLLSLVGIPAWAHSLDEVQSDLLKRESHVTFEPGVGTPFPSFRLTDADGKPVVSDDLRGKVTVLDFIYGHCSDSCLAQDARMAEIQRDVATGHMADHVRFISITVDPGRDTDVFRKGYAAAHGLDPANWSFLAATTSDETRALAKNAGAIFIPHADGTFSHPVITYIIDDDWKLRARFNGVEFAPLNAVIYINALVNDPHYHRPEAAEPAVSPSVWNRLRTFL